MLRAWFWLPKGKKKQRKPFWKKDFGPEFEHVSAHIGKAIDSGKIIDYLLYGGLAYAGYELFQDWKGALFGPVALRLAQSGNLAAGASGVAGLLLLGVAGGYGPNFEIDRDAFTGLGVAIPEKDECPTGMVKKKCLIDGQWYCRFPNQSACPPIIGPGGPPISPPPINGNIIPEPDGGPGGVGPPIPPNAGQPIPGTSYLVPETDAEWDSQCKPGYILHYDSFYGFVCEPVPTGVE